MKKLLLMMVASTFSSLIFAQKNFIDQPLVETSASADTLVTPDRIYMSIVLNEADSKNKKPLEEQEKLLEAAFRKLNIDTEKDLFLFDFASNFKSYFLKGQQVLKSKMYSLRVRDAVTVGKVLAELESVGISNVSIERTEYSKAEELILELKYIAVAKSRVTAEKLAKPLAQKVGKALYISDVQTISNALQGQAPGLQLRGSASIYGAKAADPIFVEFQKVKFEVKVDIKYALE